MEIVEFEIEHATDQIALIKKDNTNIILLLIALIGFLALIPIDLFVYKWFSLGLITLIIWLCLFFYTIYSYRKNRCYVLKEYNDIASELIQNSDKCSKCEKSEDCNWIFDDEKKKRFIQYITIHTFKHYLFKISSDFTLIFVFFLTIFLSYFYSVISLSENSFFYLYKPNLVIVILLIIEILLFSIYFVFNAKFSENQKNCQSNNVLYYVIFLLLLPIVIEIFGNLSKVPPFVQISNSTQLSVVLLNHYQNYPSIAITLILLLYQNIIFIVITDHFNTGAIVENLSEKITNLMKIKSKIDLCRLNKCEIKKTDELYKEVLLTKTASFEFITIFGFFSIPFLRDNLTTEEITELIKIS